MRRPGPMYFVILMPMMYLIWDVKTWTPAPVVKPLTIGSVKNALSDPSRNTPRRNMINPVKKLTVDITLTAHSVSSRSGHLSAMGLDVRILTTANVPIDTCFDVPMST